MILRAIDCSAQKNGLFGHERDPLRISRSISTKETARQNLRAVGVTDDQITHANNRAAIPSIALCFSQPGITWLISQNDSLWLCSAM